jgi:Coenzyme PQQ synthesis protein D (PqqD)
MAFSDGESRVSSGRRLRQASERVVHETAGGEVVLIHLETGNYYSLRGAGAYVWTLLEAGGDAQVVADAVTNRYDGDPAVIRASVTEILDRLVHEGLAAEDDIEHARAGAVENGAPPEVARPFEPPILERYTDMQEYLLVDPIHDVDGGAWPAREAAQG